MGVGPCGTKESSGRKAEVCMARHRPASSKANGECSPQGRDGIRKLTYCKQDEVLLVVLADTVIDPGTVVVHFPNAPLADAERAARQTLRGAPRRREGQEDSEPTLQHHSSSAAQCFAACVLEGPGRDRTPKVTVIPDRGTGGDHRGLLSCFTEKKAGTDSTENDTALLREEWAEILVY